MRQKLRKDYLPLVEHDWMKWSHYKYNTQTQGFKGTGFSVKVYD